MSTDTTPTPLPAVKRTISRIRLLAESARDERGGQASSFEDLALTLCNLAEAYARAPRLTEAEVNERLARVLGWVPGVFEESGRDNWTLPDGRIFPQSEVYFSPSTNRNHFAEYVLPEIERRGLVPAFLQAVADMAENEIDDQDELLWWHMMLSPAALAEAALKVLEESI